MRLDGPHDMIALATLIHDHCYPKSVMPDNPSMIRCLDPMPTCLMREYVFEAGGKPYCRAPQQYVPDEVLSTKDDCPWRAYDAKHALSAQRSAPASSMPPIRQTSDRRTRRVERLKEWVRRELEGLTSQGCVAASIYLHDLDISLSWDDIDELGEHLWKVYVRLPSTMK